MSDWHPGIDYPENVSSYEKDVLVPKLWKEIDRLRAELADVRMARRTGFMHRANAFDAFAGELKRLESDNTRLRGILRQIVDRDPNSSGYQLWLIARDALEDAS